MEEKVYVQPIGFAASPQAANGDAIRLGGSMVYASHFALIVADNGAVVSRDLHGVSTCLGGISELPEAVREDAEKQWEALQSTPADLILGERTIRLDQPQIMGILNVTPDSFSDDGEFLERPEAGQAHASAMLEAGAAIIDIGGESTRPGAAATWEGDEKERVLPAIEYCAAMGAAISVDTRRAGVLEAALEAGAHIANDVSAMRYDPRSYGVAAGSGCPVILMHAPGSGDDLHEGGNYTNVVFDVFDALREYRDAAVEAGIAAEKIILDPGIGFGKTLAENLALINALPLFHALGHPLMLGVSRKRMIGALSHEAGAHERLGGSVALATLGMNAGVHILRVHDVAESVQARNVWRGTRDAALTDFADLAD